MVIKSFQVRKYITREVNRLVLCHTVRFECTFSTLPYHSTVPYSQLNLLETVGILFWSVQQLFSPSTSHREKTVGLGISTCY